MHGTAWAESDVRGHTAMLFLSLGVISGATSLTVFGFSARVVWWRERERGVNPLSYFLASTAVQLLGGAGLGRAGLALTDAPRPLPAASAPPRPTPRLCRFTPSSLPPCFPAADVAVQPLVFLSVYYSLTLPAMPFVQLYGVGVLVVWYTASLGALVSLLVTPSSALISVVAILMVRG